MYLFKLGECKENKLHSFSWSENWVTRAIGLEEDFCQCTPFYSFCVWTI